MKPQVRSVDEGCLVREDVKVACDVAQTFGNFAKLQLAVQAVQLLAVD